MAVIFDNEKKIFTLQTDHTTYQAQVDPYGFLLHLYYGSRTKGSMEYLLTHYDRGFSGNPYDAGDDRSYSMDTLPQEYPCQGNGDFRSPCLVIKNGDQTYSCDLRYQGHEIKDGKYGITGLPAVYAKKNEAQTLEIFLEDPVSKVKVILIYGVLPEYDVITRSVKVINGGNAPIILEKIQTACLDFVSGDYDLIQFYGRHAMERNMQRTPIVHGAQVIGSRRGTSSHQHNPFMIIAGKGTDEDHGSCYGMSFVYSGNFKGEAERDQFNQTRVSMGLQDELFEYALLPGEVFDAPEVVLSYSREGLSALSHNYHRVYRRHLCRGKYKMTPRPVLLNNWEATYFDFTGDKIYEIAKQASELGVEMLVLDDGWFGKRDSDFSGLGDWFVNEAKLGGTLNSLVTRINGLGMKFGIWVEPEMVSEDSQLYRAHPDWAFIIPGRKPVRSRSQLVLDFSRPQVVDYVFDQISRVLDSANIEYVKWDMNRSITDVYSALARNNGQGEVLHRYILGLYDFLERLCKRYPDLLIEGCSGGGGRFDAGMLYYTPQIWCSDNTDAIDRIRIQYGTSFGYPVSAVGSHVSAVPNHQTGRTTPMKTRGIVAMAGSFGYELDLNKITDEDKECVKAQIQQYHNDWDLIHNGNYYRLTNPFENSETAAWEFVSDDRSEALLNVVTLDSHGNNPVSYIRLKGLDEAGFYYCESDGNIYCGMALMEAGIPVPAMEGEYQSWQMHLKIWN
ncbi:alpha-galactosidase [Clostridium sp. MCC353]|uniref:alpha-galactosidase n=1 Tax=Clostridium sp. MCC353 TaxID=2592646 RepID=UPI001C014F8F|nr:alpha-galactosidase [Clostridium sp. MCC353]MBT9775941.1 alpha-galactosidase [Clostridium sp. MCC353]